ncbi:hypothetical protein ABZ484_20845 [Streptomyces sp. NPDC006393]|uniref:hypothetical protein n=1 Tax=Streptomyces sp. NPDC006393 TaxID=3156763 RepID=UPI0033C0A64E
MRQILRRHRKALPPGLLPPVAPIEEQGPTGEYRLSTRRRQARAGSIPAETA